MIDAEGSRLLADIFNVLTTEQKNSVSPEIAERIGRYMVANGYRLFADRWYLQAIPGQVLGKYSYKERSNGR